MDSIELIFTGIVLISIQIGLIVILYRTLTNRLQSTFGELGELFEGIFEKGSVKHAMSVLGNASRKARGNRAVMNSMASQVVNGPKFAGLKLGAKALGIDIDGMIEEHGAMEVLQGAQQLAGMLGINVGDLAGSLQGGELLNTGSHSNIRNPYLKR